MNKKAVATGFFLLSFLFPLRASAASFSNLYVFGDSLSIRVMYSMPREELFPQAPSTLMDGFPMARFG
jgi:phospholipase/lecithinase/hemolysin